MTKLEKLEKIENSIIDRLDTFTSTDGAWSRDAIVQLSGALKKITVVRLMNEQTEEQEEGHITPIMGMPGFIE